ncbi:GAF domain-containing sensor histidine kinase [Sphingosinicella sp. BN140058]|uniref:GAF domain-containing sensor histidine kinase n=1 Tax=Sphingosinicella sp. BN140058 TaxID=1892855 RepID=UPI001FB0E5EF|nr:GAF domain-containing sensor histidine kinase [Sphingosinicella sp. BN140058]
MPTILSAVCRVTGMRFAAVARVTDQSWTACAVRDDIGFGIAPGGELVLATTICDEIRQSGRAVIIDHVANDPDFRDHPTPQMYGFQSYISMPIVRTNGEFFGTLCAIDPEPARLKEGPAVETFSLFAELIALHLDAGERLRRSEAALIDATHAAELRDQFIAVLGHDLRNPLASIEAGTRLLADAKLDGRPAKVLSLMQDSCRRMARLIDDVLDFARGRLGGGVTLRLAINGDLAAALEQVVAELRAVYPERDIRAEIEPVPTVICDAARLAQLLSNLLGNALRHGDPEQPVTVRASCRDGQFLLSVANGGAPISEERRRTLFDPFKRGGPGGRSEGLGLGLYIAAEIARAHGGTLSLGSEESATVFTFSMSAEPDLPDRVRPDEACIPV